MASFFLSTANKISWLKAPSPGVVAKVALCRRIGHRDTTRLQRSARATTLPVLKHLVAELGVQPSRGSSVRARDTMPLLLPKFLCVRHTWRHNLVEFFSLTFLCCRQARSVPDRTWRRPWDHAGSSPPRASLLGTRCMHTCLKPPPWLPGKCAPSPATASRSSTALVILTRAVPRCRVTSHLVERFHSNMPPISADCLVIVFPSRAQVPHGKGRLWTTSHGRSRSRRASKFSGHVPHGSRSLRSWRSVPWSPRCDSGASRRHAVPTRKAHR